jgi:Abnormal spindle-like microcephaly-assoc'd, ASPM-SPD-2-Hydin
MNKYFPLVIFGVLLWAACGGSSTAKLSVIGSPNTDLSVPNISFGAQNVGTVSAEQDITLSNTGTAELRITGIAVTAPFAETDQCASNLAAGATCTINVTFAPTIEGDFAGSLSITDNAKDSPQSVALSGSGFAPPPPCTPVGEVCGINRPVCCAAPFPHHSFCSNPRGLGTCAED